MLIIGQPNRKLTESERAQATMMFVLVCLLVGPLLGLTMNLRIWPASEQKQPRLGERQKLPVDETNYWRQ